MAGINSSVAVTKKIALDEYSDSKTDEIRSDIGKVETVQSIADGQSKKRGGYSYLVSGATYCPNSSAYVLVLLLYRSNRRRKLRSKAYCCG